MNNVVAIEFPKEFVANSLHTVWSTMSTFKTSGNSKPSDALIDLTNVRVIDAEGINYIALIPAFLREGGISVTIKLPVADNVCRFLETVGLLEQFHDRYTVHGLAKEHVPRYGEAVEVFGRNTRLISRAAQSYVFEPGTTPGIFRLEIIQHHMFDLSPETGRDFCKAIFELVRNVFDHSEETTGCVTIQFRKTPHGSRSSLLGQLFVAVSDLGIGIKTSLSERAEFDVGGSFEGFEDWQYLEYALTEGSSRFGPNIRGNGLPTVARLASKTHISSGQATLYVDRDKSQRRHVTTSPLPGTSILLIFDVFRDGAKSRNGLTRRLSRAREPDRFALRFSRRSAFR